MAAHGSGRRRRHAAHEEEHENNEPWLVTYADMITLLMVLFIVLFAVSQVDAKKFAALHDGLAQSFRQGNPAIDGGDGLLEVTRQQSAPAVDADVAAKALELVKQQATAKQKDSAALEQARRDLQAALAARGLADMVRFRIDERGLTVSIVTDKVLFPLGSAELQPQGRAVLDAVAPVLRRLPNRMAVEGHTDNIPSRDGSRRTGSCPRSEPRRCSATSSSGTTWRRRGCPRRGTPTSARSRRTRTTATASATAAWRSSCCPPWPPRQPWPPPQP